MQSHLSEAQLKAIIQRAAQLQFETEQSRTRGLLDSGPLGGSGAYSSEMVVQAAREVGISPDSVALAALDLAAAGDTDLVTWQRQVDRAAGFLAFGERRVELEVNIDAPAAVLFNSVRTVAAQSLFNLSLEGLHGRNPVEDAVLEFAFTQSWWSQESMGRFNLKMLYADIKQVLITVRRSPADPEGQSLLRIYAPLGHSLRLNHRVAIGCAGAVGAGGGVGVGALALAAGLGMFAWPLGIVAGLAVGMASVAGYRPLFKWQVREGRKSLEMFAKAVTSHALTERGMAG